MTDRVCHGVSNGTDIPMAIALGLEVVASCGTVFVPLYDQDEATKFPDCLKCHPPRARRQGSHRLSSEARGELPHYVYRCYDSDDRLLYVGCSYTPRLRLTQHRADRKKWVHLVARTRHTVFPNRRKALDMERLAIETEHPLYNLAFKRDAS